MKIEETPSYAALVAKKAEFAASQTSAGVQAPVTVALGKEMVALTRACAKETGIPFPG